MHCFIYDPGLLSIAGQLVSRPQVGGLNPGVCAINMYFKRVSNMDETIKDFQQEKV